MTDIQWEIVNETRGKLQMDEDGDQLICTWEGFETVVDPNNDDEYLYANFRDDEHGAFAMSATYQLKKLLDGVPVPSLIRLTRTGSTAMKKGNPMIHFRVEIAKTQ